jgi:hypothetical protein
MSTRTIHTSAVALLLATAAGLAAADHGHRRSDPLQGAWIVRLTPYVCGSDPIVTFPQAAADSYLTFGADGTLVEASGNATFMPGQRGPGHGQWERVGRATYTAAYQAFILFPTVPATPTSRVRGTQRFDHEIEFVDAGRWNSNADRWSSLAVVTYRDVNGNGVPPSGCAIGEAVRMP